VAAAIMKQNNERDNGKSVSRSASSVPLFVPDGTEEKKIGKNGDDLHTSDS
jgi:hypothetical protein